MSAQQLANRTKSLGHHVPRNVIANLESQRRETIALAEVLILAAALDVPPTLLIAPVGRERSMEILPGVEMSPWMARGWIHGATDVGYGGHSIAGWQDSRRAIVLYDIHRLLVREHQQMQRRINDQERLAAHNNLTGDAAVGRESLSEFVAELSYSIDRLRAHRALILSEGFVLPELPPGVAVALKEPTSSGRHRTREDGRSNREGLAQPMLYDQLSEMLPRLPAPDHELRDD